MTSNSPRKRRASSKPANPFNVRFSAFQQRLVYQFREGRRQHQLRRQRQQRQLAINPVAHHQLAGLRRALQFRWLQRFLQRSQPERLPGSSPRAWFWPRNAAGLSTRDAAARVMRHAAAALMLLLLINLVLSSVPVKLTTPNWYLEVLALVGESISVIVVACVFVLLSFTLDREENPQPAYLTKIFRLSRIGYLFALLLLPLQLSAIAWLFGDAFNSNRIQLNAVRSSADALIAGAQQATTSGEFVAYLRSRNFNINLQSIRQAPLDQVRTEFIRSVKVQQQQQEQNLAAATRTNLFRFAVNGLKLFLVLVVLAAFLRGYLSILRHFFSQVSTHNLMTDSNQGEPSGLLIEQWDAVAKDDNI